MIDCHDSTDMKILAFPKPNTLALAAFDILANCMEPPLYIRTVAYLAYFTGKDDAWHERVGHGKVTRN